MHGEQFNGKVLPKIFKNRWIILLETHTTTMELKKVISLPMMYTQEAGFLVLITNWAQVAPNYFEIGILSNIVFGHLKHSQMQVCDWAERAAGYKNDGGLLWMD